MEVDFMSNKKESKIFIFISGSRSITELSDNVKKFIKKYVIDNEFEVLIGDCSGVDSEVQKFLRENKYNKVTVYSSGDKPRNYYGDGIDGWSSVCLKLPEVGDIREYYATKDKIMTEKCDTALAIWDGTSSATGTNIDRCLVKGKDIWLITRKNKHNDNDAYDECVMWYDSKGYPVFVTELPINKLLVDTFEEVIDNITSVEVEKTGYTKIIGKKGKLALKFDNDVREYIIQHNDIYGDYIKIRNPYVIPGEPDAYDASTFAFRFKDAYNSVEEGYGDCITLEYFDRCTIPMLSVLWFLDRDIGRCIRNKTLKNWQNVKFSTCILHRGVDNGTYIIGNAQGYMFKADKYLASSKMPLTFKSIPAANDFLMSTINIVKIIYNSVDSSDINKHYKGVRNKLTSCDITESNNNQMRSNVHLSICKRFDERVTVNDLYRCYFKFGQVICADTMEELMDIINHKKDMFFDLSCRNDDIRDFD